MTKWLARLVGVMVIVAGLSIAGGMLYLIDHVRDESARQAARSTEELDRLDRLYSLLEVSVDEHRAATEGDVNRILRTLLNIGESLGLDTTELDPGPSDPIIRTETEHFHHHHPDGETRTEHFHHHHQPEHFHHHHPDEVKCDNAITEATGDCR